VIKSLEATAAVVALGGIGAVAIQAPARAAGFSAAYTCVVPMLGTKTVTVDGTLTATPDPATAGTPTRLRLHISRLSLRSPVTINSWTATATIDVSGAQTASLRLTGTGRAVPARQQFAGDLSGDWTPSTHGTDRFRAGNVTLRADISLLGTMTVPCTPKDPRPVIATLTVTPPHHA
jgi:hypothetical protein